MKMSMGLKKGDIMTEAMEGFWGKTTKPEIVQEQVNVIGMSQDILTPQEAYDDYQTEGMSIKEKVEADINATQDLTPDARAAARYSGAIQGRPAQQANPFDLGGLDAMNQRQLAKERGSGLGIGLDLGMAPKKLSYAERMLRKQAEFEFKANKQVAGLNAQERRAHINEFIRQSRSRTGTEAEIKRTLRADTQRKDYESGLPVYSSPLDVLVGGRKKAFEKNAAGEYKATGTYERVGGIFGLGKEMYKGYKDVSSTIKSHAKRVEQEQELYETKAQKDIREEKERKDALNKVKARIEEYKPTTRNIVEFGSPMKKVVKTPDISETIITPQPAQKSIVPSFISNIFGGNKSSPTSFEIDKNFSYEPSQRAMPNDEVAEIVNREMASMNKDKNKNPMAIKDLRDVKK